MDTAGIMDTTTYNSLGAYWEPLFSIKIINFTISSRLIDFYVCPIYWTDSLWDLTVDTVLKFLNF